MRTFYQVLEDHAFPQRLADFFAFAHKEGYATSRASTMIHSTGGEYTAALRKAIAGIQ